MDLSVIETYYDTVPRTVAATEECGPFTLFIAEDDTGWQFYARPRLGLAHDFTSDDVRAALARLRELGKPEAIEWVDEVTPSLLPAVRSVLPTREIEECPLLVLETVTGPIGTDPPGRHVVLGPDDPDLALAVGAVSASFAGSDDVTPGGLGRRPHLISTGELLVAASYDDSGALVGAGSAAPRDGVAELMGIGVLPRARRRGVGAAITRALVRELAARGASLAFLSAASEEASSVYRAVGFTRVGTACILGGD